MASAGMMLSGHSVMSPMWQYSWSWYMSRLQSLQFWMCLGLHHGVAVVYMSETFVSLPEGGVLSHRSDIVALCCICVPSHGIPLNPIREPLSPGFECRWLWLHFVCFAPQFVSVFQFSGGNQTFDEAGTRQAAINLDLIFTSDSVDRIEFPVPSGQGSTATFFLPLRLSLESLTLHSQVLTYVGHSRVMVSFCFDVFRVSNRFKQALRCLFGGSSDQSLHS